MDQEKKQEQEVSVKPQEEVKEPKKKSKTILTVVIVALVVFFVVIIAVLFIFKAFVKEAINSFTGKDNILETILDKEKVDLDINEEEEDWFYEKSTEEKVDGKLENEEEINEEFPKDIPLSGGVVVSSAYNEGYSVEVAMEVNSSVGEITEWYDTKLKEAGWSAIIEGEENESMEGYEEKSITFKNMEETRDGKVRITTSPYQDFSNVTIILYLF